MRLRSPITLLLLVRLTTGWAQGEVRITDPQALEEAPAVNRVEQVEAALLRAGLSAREVGIVSKYGAHRYWPSGIASPAQRTANRPYLVNYVVFRLATFQRDTADWSVVMVPANENLHMPERLRPKGDFFLVLPSRALQGQPRPRPRPPLRDGPAWHRRKRARILQPAGLYGNYALKDDSTALQAMRQAGMDEGAIQVVAFRSKQANWPEAINSFDKRQHQLKRIAKYRTYEAARWEDKVLLIVPAKKNARMPKAMRPCFDIYFVHALDGIRQRRQ